MTTSRNPAWQTEVDRLQRENGSLARAYAACERLLRDSTEENARLKELYGAAMDGLNKVDAENERLKTELDNTRRERDLFNDQADNLSQAHQERIAENERLRAALEDIADIAHPPDMRSVNIARRALGRTTDYGESAR